MAQLQQFAPVILECAAAFLVTYACWTYLRGQSSWNLSGSGSRKKYHKGSRTAKAELRCCMQKEGTFFQTDSGQFEAGGDEHFGCTSKSLSADSKLERDGHLQEHVNAAKNDPGGCCKMDSTKDRIGHRENAVHANPVATAGAGLTCGTSCGSCNTGCSTADSFNVGRTKIFAESKHPQPFQLVQFGTLDPPGKVFYASETGTSRRLAEEVAVVLQHTGLSVQVVDPAKYEPEDLPKEKLVVLVVSTWQDGAAPQHASFLGQWLAESAEDFRVGSALLSELSFAVFGVGSGAYGQTYNAVARAWDDQLAALGASRLVTRGEGDVDEGHGDQGVEHQFRLWVEALVQAVTGGEEGPETSGERMMGDSLAAATGDASGAQGSDLGSGRGADADRGVGETASMEPNGTKEGSGEGVGGWGLRNGERKLLEGLEGNSMAEEDEEYESEDEEEDDGIGTTSASDLVDVEDVAGRRTVGADWGWAGEVGDEDGGARPTRQGGSNGTGSGSIGDGTGGSHGAGRGGVKKKWFVRKAKPRGGRGAENGAAKGRPAAVVTAGRGGASRSENGEGPREMVTPVVRANLEKQGYKVLGTHSGVKLCRWTKSQLRGRGGCYKHSFYGIESHRCMEATPSLACANKCVFCWRHHTNPVGKSWRWQVDAPEDIVEGALDQHCRMIRQMKGVPGVRPERLEEGLAPRHCALSLVGEPIMYPHISELVGMLHSRRISTFLVTNAQFPERIAALTPITQLYVSVDAATRESLKAIDRPLFADFWERFTASLVALRGKRQRTVYRLTLVKGWNMEALRAYCALLDLGSPDFVEIKGVTYCGSSATSSLTMENVPWHSDVKAFGEAMAAERKGEYEMACEHEHSCCILLAKTAKFKRDGHWHTWIDYERFQDLVASGEPFGSEDYMARTPDWAVYGAVEGGFDPQETRVKKERRHGTAPASGGCT